MMKKYMFVTMLLAMLILSSTAFAMNEDAFDNNNNSNGTSENNEGNFSNNHNNNQTDIGNISRVRVKEQNHDIKQVLDKIPANNVSMNQSSNVTQSNETSKDLFNLIIKNYQIKVDMSIPSYIPFQNEKFNIYTAQKEFVGTLTIEKGIITNLSKEILNDQTYDVYVDFEKLFAIEINKGEEVDFNKILDAADVKLEGKTFAKKTKGVFMKMALGIMKIFG